MFPRVREISDAFGARLRVRLEAHPAGAVVTLERPDQRRRSAVMLDGYGIEVLAAFIMAARLAMPQGLPEEQVDGRFAASFGLEAEPRAIITIAQEQLEQSLEIPATFWDRLYAELGLVVAHARELSRRSGVRVQ